MKTIVKPVTEMTQTEYRACYAANYGYTHADGERYGFMQPQLSDCRKGYAGKTGIAIMIWDGPADKVSSLKAWSLVQPISSWGQLAASWYIRKKSSHSAMFWVKRQYRRQGLGTLLMLEVKKICPRPYVIPHDKVSGELFSKFDVSAAGKARRKHIKRKQKVA